MKLEKRGRGKNVSYVETGLVILSSLLLVRFYNSNLKALKLIRSFFITQGSRLSLHWVHRLLLSGIDPFLRLRGGNYSEIFAMQSGEPTLFDFPFKSAIGCTTPFPSKRAGLYRIPIVDNLLELDE